VSISRKAYCYSIESGDGEVVVIKQSLYGDVDDFHVILVGISQLEQFIADLRTAALPQE
jgi:hypothetical protein